MLMSLRKTLPLISEISYISSMSGVNHVRQDVDLPRAIGERN